MFKNGSDVSLDFVVPKAEGGANTTMSYNSLLGSKEIVNIPVLWVDDEIYACIDGIYNAMEELILKPRVTGNMDKIPYYDTEYNRIIETESVILEGINGNGEIAISDGFYIPIDELKEKCGGTFDEKSGLYQIYFNQFGNNYKINVNTLANKNKIVNRIDDIEIYKQNSEFMMLSGNLPTGVTLEEKRQAKKDGKNFYIDNSAVNTNIKKVVVRSFIKSFNGRKLYPGELEIINSDENNKEGTVAVIEYRILGSFPKSAVFFAVNSRYSYNEAVKNRILMSLNNKKEYDKYKSTKDSDGNLLVYNCCLADAFGISENAIYHVPGDEFSSASEAFEMFKQYYNKDLAFIKYPGKILGTAIYEYKVGGEKKYTYSDRIPYDSLLNLFCMNGNTDRDKPIFMYAITHKLNDSQIMEVRKLYKYTNITLY